MNEDPFQLSDIALKWMIDELDLLPDDQILWNKSKDNFTKRFRDSYLEALTSTIHDTLRFGGGSAGYQVILWNFLGKPAPIPSTRNHTFCPLNHYEAVYSY